MKRVLHVAKTEVIEHRRQPSMLVILAFNYIFWGGVFVFMFAMLNVASQNPDMMHRLDQQALGLGLCDGESALDALLRLTTSTFGATAFTNLPFFVAFMSGYSVLHDRTHNALPFLMLAPLSRYQLLLGKLIGASALPYLIHLVGLGLVTAVVGSMSVMDGRAAQFGGSAAWWVAFLVGAPATGLLVGSLGTVISALSRDVRTSIQFIWFFMGILSLAFGYVLFDTIPSGVGTQLGFAAGALVLGLLVLLIGSRVVSREFRA